MKHGISSGDERFRRDFEAGRIPPAGFDHRAHLRLAYVYLCGHDTESAYALMREGIQRFLARHGIDAGKYHETLTRAWMLAVRHFMVNSSQSGSFGDFVRQHPVMLDPQIMLTHYSRETLFSPQARAGFVKPDIDPIPSHP